MSKIYNPTTLIAVLCASAMAFPAHSLAQAQATGVAQQSDTSSTTDTSVPPPPADAMSPATEMVNPSPAATGSQSSSSSDQQVVPPSVAAPATGSAPSAATPAEEVPAAIPTLGDVLDEQGVAQQPTSGASDALPPGFDLPVDQAAGVTQKTKEEKELELRKKAFDSVVNGMYPLKPDEIRKLMELQDEANQAVKTPLYPNPTPESAFMTVSLDPGTKPVTVKTAIGNVTTLSMVDASGQPWPIQDMTWAGNFEILQPETGGHMLRITPLGEFASGNISMRMIGLNPPIIISLRADRETVHVRLDLQIPELGPNGVAPLIGTSNVSTSAGDGKLASILEGVAPSSAKKLKVNGVDGRTSAYALGGTTYLRTPYTLLSPAWNSSARSADGTNVYSLGSAPVLILSDKGKMVRAYLSGEETANGQ